MWHSLRFRVFLTLIIVVVMAIGTVALFANRATTTEFQRYVERSGTLRDRRIEVFLTRYYDQRRSWAGVQPLLEEMGDITGERIILVDQKGEVIADSGKKLIGQKVGRDWMGPAVHIVSRGMPAAAVYVDPFGSSRDPQHEAFLASINRALIVAAVVAGAAAIILTLSLSRRILRPIEALTAAARRMESGDLSQRVAVQSKDEVGELARAFNAMAEGLARLEKVRRNMVRDAAHELRTPLSNIRGYLEALRDGVTSPSPALIDSLYEETMLLSRLVDDLQDLSLAEARKLKLERRPVAISEVVNRVAEVISPKIAAKGITLKVDVPTDLPLLNADPFRLGQIVENLLRNALSRTPPNGTIMVVARATDSEVKVSVGDTGEPIAPEHLPHIFERFYRVDPSRSRETGGTGLELALARELARAHGGDVTVHTAPHEGSMFTLHLPLG